MKAIFKATKLITSAAILSTVLIFTVSCNKKQPTETSINNSLASSSLISESNEILETNNVTNFKVSLNTTTNTYDFSFTVQKEPLKIKSVIISEKEYIISEHDIIKSENGSITYEFNSKISSQLIDIFELTKATFQNEKGIDYTIDLSLEYKILNKNLISIVDIGDFNESNGLFSVTLGNHNDVLKNGTVKIDFDYNENLVKVSLVGSSNYTYTYKVEKVNDQGNELFTSVTLSKIIFTLNDEDIYIIENENIDLNFSSTISNITSASFEHETYFPNESKKLFLIGSDLGKAKSLMVTVLDKDYILDVLKDNDNNYYCFLESSIADNFIKITGVFNGTLTTDLDIDVSFDYKDFGSLLTISQDKTDNLPGVDNVITFKFNDQFDGQSITVNDVVYLLTDNEFVLTTDKSSLLVTQCTYSLLNDSTTQFTNTISILYEVKQANEITSFNYKANETEIGQTLLIVLTPNTLCKEGDIAKISYNDQECLFEITEDNNFNVYVSPDILGSIGGSYDANIDVLLTTGKTIKVNVKVELKSIFYANSITVDYSSNTIYLDGSLKDTYSLYSINYDISSDTQLVSCTTYFDDDNKADSFYQRKLIEFVDDVDVQIVLTGYTVDLDGQLIDFPTSQVFDV